MNIRDYIRDYVIDEKSKRILEIGPLNRPIICKKDYPNSFYGDIRSTDDIKKLYSGNEYLETTGITVETETIVSIDFVLKDGYQKTFQNIEKFDFVVSSHVLEHVDDLIGTLQDIASVLKPQGKVCIIYPDKRFSFDHFRESASFRDAFETYISEMKLNEKMVLDFYFSAIDENNPQKFWYPKELELLMPENDFEKARLLYEKAKEGYRAEDVHYWPMTDFGFVKFIYDCLRAKLLPYHLAEFYPTQDSSQEFLAILEYDENIILSPESALNNLKQIISHIPLDYYNAYYAMGIQNGSVQKQFMETKNYELEQMKRELEQYNEIVKQQQAALEEYAAAYSSWQDSAKVLEDEVKKRDEIIKNNEEEFVKYRKIVEIQQAALEEYANASNMH